jgi:hypothetical protein
MDRMKLSLITRIPRFPKAEMLHPFFVRVMEFQWQVW